MLIRCVLLSLLALGNASLAQGAEVLERARDCVPAACNLQGKWNASFTYTAGKAINSNPKNEIEFVRGDSATGFSGKYSSLANNSVFRTTCQADGSVIIKQTDDKPPAGFKSYKSTLTVNRTETNCPDKARFCYKGSFQDSYFKQAGKNFTVGGGKGSVVITPIGGQVPAPAGCQLARFGFALDAERKAIVDDKGALWVYDAANREQRIEGTLPMADAKYIVALSATRIAVVQGNGKVTLIEVKAPLSAVSSPAVVPMGGAQAVFPWDANRIAVLDSHNQVLLVQVDQGGAAKSLNATALYIKPKSIFTLAGTQVVIVEADGKVSVYDMAGLTVKAPYTAAAQVDWGSAAPVRFIFPLGTSIATINADGKLTIIPVAKKTP